jgi:hypothetical protein
MSDFPEHVAWTGGSSPAPYDEISDLEREYVEKLFDEQADLWLDHWSETELPEDVQATFWQRARYDAHATFRAEAARKRRTTNPWNEIMLR